MNHANNGRNSMRMDGKELTYLPLLSTLETAKGILLNGAASLSPMFFFTKDAELRVLSVPPAANFGDSEHKRALGVAFNKLVRENEADACWLISEAWAKTGDINEEGLAEDMETIKKHGLAGLPRNKKREVIMVSFTLFRPTMERWMGLIDIIRDKQGVIHNFGVPEWVKADSDMSVAGNFVF